MTTQPTVFTRPSRAVAALVSLLLALSFAGVAAATSAQAHDELVSSNPATKARLDAAPKELTLTFSSAPMKDTVKIVAVDANAQPVALDTPKVAGKVVTVPWPTQQAGSYEVTWRVVSSDGHPINGAIAFQVLGSDSASPSAPTEDPSDSTVATDEPTANDPANSSSSNTAGMIAGLAAAGVAAVVLVAIMIRRRQNNDEGPGASN